MSAGDWFLVIALLAASGTVLSSISFSKPLPIFIIPLFIISLVTSELTLFMVILQGLVSLIFIAFGALSETTGKFALLLMLVSWLGMYRLHLLSREAERVCHQALVGVLGPDYLDAVPAERRSLIRGGVDSKEWLRPFTFNRYAVERLTDISYGEAGERNLLDIYRPASLPAEGCPVLLQVHGGAWFMGHKQQQAMPLMYHLAQRGWLCVSINYRLSPAHEFPAHIIDVKKAIAWIREHIAEYGGNSDFIALTGGSAGGHLTALAALSANDPRYQPGFEDADTAVDAAVPFYGVYDFLDHSGLDHNVPLREMLADKIMGCTSQQDTEHWEQASPVVRVNEQAPPFLVIHGAADAMTAPEEAVIFAGKLGDISSNPVGLAVLPAAQHAFDNMYSVRTGYTINHAHAFLEWARARKTQIA